ncbi:MAG: hypothetical protein ICV60_11455 [Pyrinomonadaceae bacterium]|nr:hypothetical protein [Pyrinomonadaceae bacterium]
MIRAAALSLLMFVSVAVTLPLADSLAEGLKGNRPSASRSARRRHSRAWWRRYRSRLARRRAAEARARQIAALRGEAPVAPESLDRSRASNAVAATGGVFNDPSGQWSMRLPRGWSNRPAIQNGEMRFRVFEKSGKPVGQAAFAFVTSAQPVMDGSLSARARKQMLAGVPFSELRSAVIDRMVMSNGFVTNDIEREIAGRKVYVVLAQTAASSDGRTPEQFLTFYFMEFEGRIYSLGVAATRETANRLNAEAEQVLNSLSAGNR